jgi:hypothetical protein
MILLGKGFSMLVSSLDGRFPRTQGFYRRMRVGASCRRCSGKRGQAALSRSEVSKPALRGRAKVLAALFHDIVPWRSKEPNSASGGKRYRERVRLVRKALLLIYVLGIPCALWSQSGQTSWMSLNSLFTGQKIQIVETNSKKHSGSFIRFSDMAISYQDNNAGQQSIQRKNVRSVKFMGNVHRLRNTLIGLGVGGGLGAGIGAATYHKNACQPTSFCFSGIGGRGLPTAIGAVLGTAGGVIVGALWPSHKTIYDINSR